MPEIPFFTDGEGMMSDQYSPPAGLEEVVNSEIK